MSNPILISNISIPNINISKYLIPYWYVDQFDIIGRPSLPTTRQPYNGPIGVDLVLWSLIRATAVCSLDHSFVSGCTNTRIRFRANVFQSSTLTADGNLGRVAGTGDGAFQTSISAQGNELKVLIDIVAPVFPGQVGRAVDHFGIFCDWPTTPVAVLLEV